MKIPVLLFALTLLPLCAARGQGAIKATTRVMPDGSTLTTITNPDTRTREETIAEMGGKVRSRTVYTLNDQAFALGAIHFDAKGAIRYKEVYAFDYSGRITESKFYSADNRPLGKRVFIVDGKSSQARVEDYDANGNLISAGAKPAATRSAQPEVRKATPVR